MFRKLPETGRPALLVQRIRRQSVCGAPPLLRIAHFFRGHVQRLVDGALHPAVLVENRFGPVQNPLAAAQGAHKRHRSKACRTTHFLVSTLAPKLAISPPPERSFRGGSYSMPRATKIPARQELPCLAVVSRSGER